MYILFYNLTRNALSYPCNNSFVLKAISATIVLPFIFRCIKLALSQNIHGKIFLLPLETLDHNPGIIVNAFEFE
ncbi:hypothetical protein VNO78_10955 [Psophocarpus tetragonolobus]|uniref:Uncharacterized protein n=1 Tax=Psophocarpus tetragonolobus TaxID=3891 RepID=A0AAN9SLG8_PSOTE